MIGICEFRIAAELIRLGVVRMVAICSAAARINEFGYPSLKAALQNVLGAQHVNRVFQIAIRVTARSDHSGQVRHNVRPVASDCRPQSA